MRTLEKKRRSELRKRRRRAEVSKCNPSDAEGVPQLHPLGKLHGI
jgi:hypothetical protein